MKVLLRTDISGLGERGEIIDVADGYARNFLVPTGRVIVATAKITAQAAAMRRARGLKYSRDRESAEAIAGQLASLVVRIPARAGSEGRLFGSVTSSDVSEAVAEQGGVELDRRRIVLEEPIRSLGVHEVPVKLHPEVEFKITVEVVSGR